MIKNCPICGKAFDVLYPDIWRYKRNNRFICSWKCIRLFDGKEEKQVKERVSVKKTRMSRDDMAEAVRMWKANDPGLDQYLTDHGITHIGKWKQNARDRYGVAAPATVKVDGPIRIETPEAHNVDIVETPEQAVIKNKVVDLMEEFKIRNPLQYEEFTVREVEGLFGRYRRSDIGQETYIDFEPLECVDVISNTLTQWSSFMKELKRAAQVLGVGL